MSDLIVFDGQPKVYKVKPNMAVLTLRKSEIPDGGALVVNVHDRLKVALFRVGDRVAAINNRCPHRGGALGEGPFDGTLVKCPLHGFRVNVWTGIGNAGKPVQTFPVELVGEEIHLTTPEPAAE
jgi:nitrite reductase/ring-hydroxylating ferredoxin subunit